ALPPERRGCVRYCRWRWRDREIMRNGFIRLGWGGLVVMGIHFGNLPSIVGQDLAAEIPPALQALPAPEGFCRLDEVPGGAEAIATRAEETKAMLSILLAAFFPCDAVASWKAGEPMPATNLEITMSTMSPQALQT